MTRSTTGAVDTTVAPAAPARGRSRRPALLLLVAGGAATLEAVALQAVHFTSALVLAPQVSAPAPFGVFHDLRWVFTYSWSWWSLTWQLVALVVFRTLLDATLIHLAWPTDRTRPAYLTLVRRSLLYTPAALVLLSPWAATSFAGASIGYSPFVLGTIVASAVTAVVLPPGVITGDWWRRTMPWRSLPYVLAAWLGLMLAADAITFSPAWVTVLVSAAAGLLNAWSWRRIVRAVVGAGAPRWTVPLAPVVALATVAAMVVGGAAIGGRVFGASSHHSSSGSADGWPVGGTATLYVAGFESSYDGKPFHLLGPKVSTYHFSYRGLAPNGRPLPYDAARTHQSVDTSARLLAQQVDWLHRATGKRVTVVAESEGTMVAVAYFATHPHPPVRMFIETSPLIRPARVFYPSEGHAGYGVGGGWESRGLLWLIRHLSSGTSVHADMPFIRSVVAHPRTFRDQTLCPPTGVPSFMFVPMEAALTVPRGPFSRMPWTVQPAYHASLVDNSGIRSDIRRLITTGTPPHRSGWEAAFSLIRGAAGAWEAPALPLSLYPGHQDGTSADPAFGHRGCQSTG